MLTGSFRILLANVLGFDLDEEKQIYTRHSGVDAPRDLRSLLSFLTEHGVAFQLDASSNELLAMHASYEHVLREARIAGEKVKRYPPKRVPLVGFKRMLKPYQQPAVAHMLAVENAANFSVPGSGKTTIVLAAFSVLRERGDVDCLVIVCPRAAFATWEEESRDSFSSPPKVTRLSGTKADRVRLYTEARNADILVITYQTLANDSDEVATLLRTRRSMMVLDESHYIKRMEGGKWAAVSLDIAPLAKRRAVLSGTPVPNGLEDLWSQMAFLWPDPNPLGSRDQYRSTLKGEDDHATAKVKGILRPFYWRIKKSDLGLPPQVFHRVGVPMQKFQSGIYRALAAKVLADVVPNPGDRLKLRQWRRARMIRLLQAATNPSLLSEHSPEFRIPPLDASGLSIESVVEKYSQFETPAKIDYAVGLVDSLIKKGNKVILWTSFVHNIRTLARMLSSHSPRLVYGDVPKDDNEDENFNREKMISEFKTSDKFPLLIGNPAACAESISLHRICKHAVYVDRTFNGAHYLQSLDRIHRIGLKRNERVHYYILQAEETIDEVIDERLESKKIKMLKILDDDFKRLDLDSAQDIFSEDSEEDRDFQTLIEFLKMRNSKPRAT